MAPFRFKSPWWIGAMAIVVVAGATASIQQQTPTVLQLLAQRKYVEAETAVLKVLETNPNAGQAWINLGLARVGQKKYNEALEAYEKAAAIPPVRATAL
ncbi:MAG TPA: tetratricopeptide repeat protein, partial [Fimbriimonas sp.]|nr:tetratricopeptide repeat protein [Fimbriimonas sp.]